MKFLTYTGILAATVTSFSAKAENDTADRFSFSARMGFNISAKFKNAIVAPTLRTTPDGALYNYDDGYILNDSSDSAGGMTWNWGYDNDAQIDSINNTVALSSSTGSSGSQRKDDDFAPGAEIVYSRQLGQNENLRYGLEIAGNFLSIGVKNSSSVNRVTDFYSYVPGTTPPAASYQGTFNGPGFVILTNVANTITSSISERQKFDGDLWGFRFGPYLEYPITETLNVSLIGGVAFGIMESEVSWKQTAGASGRDNDSAFLWGGYVGANLSWEFHQDWSLIGGAQFQTMGEYRHSFNGRKVEVDLARSIFVTLGIGYSF